MAFVVTPEALKKEAGEFDVADIRLLDLKGKNRGQQTTRLRPRGQPPALRPRSCRRPAARRALVACLACQPLTALPSVPRSGQRRPRLRRPP